LAAGGQSPGRAIVLTEEFGGLVEERYVRYGPLAGPWPVESAAFGFGARGCGCGQALRVGVKVGQEALRSEDGPQMI
jgi:hypothetical protein